MRREQSGMIISNIMRQGERSELFVSKIFNSIIDLETFYFRINAIYAEKYCQFPTDPYPYLYHPRCFLEIMPS